MDRIKEHKEQKEHKLTLIEQKKLEITGIEEVDSFNQEEVILVTHDNNLIAIRGEDLNVKNLNTELGKVNIEGMVYEILYAAQRDGGKKGKGLMGRLFR
ncbi:sporulation protein YabP [Anaerobranca californiensis DSM 14826]|jgi:sporulation protein YabP|uniref:Sporulation protein YabP n=2 Tax=Anaerobranca TaxID=42447 RepID=A0A1M6PI22_9FIRM|nr:sporulation protein YabP [Anaerobranca californiensis]SHK07564.1 sporulation protein YabP [Anaerobranca californiensis DSM 14826]